MKCIVKNIAVDISFNQLAGLSSLCFLEQVWSSIFICMHCNLSIILLFPQHATSHVLL